MSTGQASSRVGTTSSKAPASARRRDGRKPLPFNEAFFKKQSHLRTKGELFMSIAQTLLAEFETQAPITRRFLERLPEDKLTWKPHERSMTAGQLAYHLAWVPGGAVRVVQNNPVPAPDFANFPQPANRQ